MDKKKQKKKSTKQKQKQHQSVNVNVVVGDQKRARRRQRAPQSVPKSHIVAPHIVVRNIGDPTQTIAQFNPQTQIPIPPPPPPPKANERPPIAVKTPPVKVKTESPSDMSTIPLDGSHRDIMEINRAFQNGHDVGEWHLNKYRRQGNQSGANEFSSVSMSSPPIYRYAGGGESGVVFNSDNFSDSGNESTVKITRDRSRKKGGAGGGSAPRSDYMDLFPHLAALYIRNKAAYRREADRIRKQIRENFDRQATFPLNREDEVGRIITEYAVEHPPVNGWKGTHADGGFLLREQPEIADDFTTPVEKKDDGAGDY